MVKLRTKAIFKPYNQQQALLLPPTLDELIPSTHLVRVVNQVVEEMDIAPLIEQYQGVPAAITPGCCLRYCYMVIV